MTREEALKWSELFKAFAEGKTIQYKGRDNIFRDDDNFSVTCILETKLDRRRIKPEQKHIPYTWGDWKEFMGKEVLDKNGHLWLIIGLDRFEIIIECDEDSKCIKLKDSFLKLRFADGTPFGKLMEE